MSKQDLDPLGNWKQPAPPDAGAIATFLETLVDKSESGIRNRDAVDYLLAVRVAFEELADEVYFSDVGRQLVVRHLGEAMLRALNLEINRTFTDLHDVANFRIASIDAIHFFRDGGSFEFIGESAEGRPAELFLQVALDADDRFYYADLYPSTFYDRKYCHPIAKDSAEEQAIVAALKDLQGRVAGGDRQAELLAGFIEALADRRP